MKNTLVSMLSVMILAAVQATSTFAQSFPNDNDGLLDVGEAPGFPAEPAVATGELSFGRRNIQDLDGTRLLANLKELDLSGNDVTSIEPGDFEGLVSLQRLALRHNGITSIEPGDFEGLTNLQSLDLYSNDITSIEPGDFDGLDNLRVLDLSFNGYIIERGDFHGLDGLTELRLTGNAKTKIQSGDFEGLDNLRALELQLNGITRIEPGDFDGLDNLQSLKLRNNEIARIEPGDFAGLNTLQRLDLAENAITSIEPGDFDGLDNLQILDLSQNQISKIERGAFQDLANLHTLVLRFNDLASIESGAFAGLTDLESLSLHTGRSKLNLTAAAFGNLQPRSGGGFSLPQGFSIVDSRELASLVLDVAQLSHGSFDAIVDQATSLVDVSLVGLTFTDENPSDLSNLLSIPTLENVTVDPSLFGLYETEFNAFAAVPGKTVLVVPEPTGTATLLIVVLGVVVTQRTRSQTGR